MQIRDDDHKTANLRIFHLNLGKNCTFYVKKRRRHTYKCIRGYGEFTNGI